MIARVFCFVSAPRRWSAERGGGVAARYRGGSAEPPSWIHV